MIALNIKEKILKIAHEKKIFRFSDVAMALKQLTVSRQYVSSVLNSMVKSGKLAKEGYGRYTYYALSKNAHHLGKRLKVRLRNQGLEEDVVYNQIENSGFLLNKLKENVHSIFRYAFMEMLNNAIEHSQSSNIEIEVSLTNNVLKFVVDDSGIGVFRNVMQKKRLNFEIEAIQEILKGKVTTAPRAHSGEGIFFTSKAADIFILESFGWRLRVDNTLPDVFVEELVPAKRGTRVTFVLAQDSKRHLKSVFEKYQTDPDDFAFDKTEIMVKLYKLGTIYISRSQARRILHGLEKYKSVALDFDQVPTIGQAFADEIFRVFKIKHPEVTIESINMNKAVEFMVRRVARPE